MNSRKALWARPQKDVSDEEYAEFYRHVSHDWREPLTTIRLAAEGTFEYQALLFLPTHAPMDLFLREGKRGVQLYVRRVFIMDDCEALVPEYLRFVKGVVDAADLSLNISREILQQDRQIQLIRKRLVKKVLSTVKTLLTDEPEKYATFWSEMGRAVKEGLLSDYDNRDAILEICSFPSTHDAEQPTTLRDYLARMPEGQDAIYYGTGPSRSALEHSPHLEAFRAKGYEVLLLTDPVDEVWVDAVPAFEGKSFVSVAKGEVDLGGDDVDDAAKQGFAELLTWMGTALAEDVKEVRLSHRLTDSAACLVGEARRPHTDAGEDVPGDGAGAAEGQADPGAEPAARAGHRAARGARPPARTTRRLPTRPTCSTAWRCSPRAASWPSPPRSWRSCRGSWSRRSRRRTDPSRALPRGRHDAAGERADPMGLHCPRPRERTVAGLAVRAHRVTGVIDAVSLLALGRVFVANITGTVVALGLSLAGAPGVVRETAIVALVVFVLGAYSGGNMIARFGGHRGQLLACAVAVELIFVLAAIPVAVPLVVSVTPVSSVSAVVAAALLAFGMGIQNAAVRRLKVPDITTTVVTMAVTGLAADEHGGGRQSIVRRGPRSWCCSRARPSVRCSC